MAFESTTSEHQYGQGGRRYDLEDRLLDFAVNIVELTESFRIRGLEITLRANFCGAERRRYLIMAR